MSRRLCELVAAGVVVASCGVCMAETPDVAIFETGATSATPVSAEAVAKRAGWTAVPEADWKHEFKGDAALANGRLAVVLRRGAPGAELYSLAAGGAKLRASLLPAAGGPVKLVSVKAETNTTTEAQVRAIFKTAKNEDAALSFSLSAGNPSVRTQSGKPGVSLRVEAPCRFVVAPEFAKGKEDALLDATRIQGERAKATAGNFALHLLGEGDAIVVVARDVRESAIEATVSAQDGTRLIAGTETPYGNRGQVWVAVIEGSTLWQPVKGGDKTPYEAQWKTVGGEAGVVYLRERTQKTPLETFTVMDAIRTALGPGPCRSILDLDEVRGPLWASGEQTGEKRKVMTQPEIDEWLSKEDAKQKQLRAELVDPAKKGERIYYNSSFEGKSQLYKINPDGSGFAPIMPKAADWKEEVAYPHMSPDGKRLAFQTPGHKWTKEEMQAVVKDPNAPASRLTAPNPHGIWLMGSDGSDPRLVAMGLLPHWSADGRYLAYATYTSPRDRMFCVMDVEGKKEWTFKGPGAGTPRFTPDGKCFVTGANQMYLLDMKEIVAGNAKPPALGRAGCGLGCNEEISPDGKWLVHCLDGRSGAYLHYDSLDPAKKESGNVKLGWDSNKTASYFPDFSPGGGYLVYAHWDTSGPNWHHPGVNGDLYVARWPADGVNVRITWHGGFTMQPQWWGPPAAEGKAEKKAEQANAERDKRGGVE